MTEQTEQTAQTGPKRILVVEDNIEFAEILVKVLSQENYIVHTVTRPGLAIRYIQKVPIHVALVDIAMPEMDGWELSRQIRTIPNPPRIILMTGGDIGPEHYRLAETHGITELLHKPMSVNELARMIRDLIEKT